MGIAGELAAEVNVEVLAETSTMLYLVLPQPPAPSQLDGLSDEDLEQVAGGRFITPELADFYLNQIVQRDISATAKGRDQSADAIRSRDGSRSDEDRG